MATRLLSDLLNMKSIYALILTLPLIACSGVGTSLNMGSMPSMGSSGSIGSGGNTSSSTDPATPLEENKIVLDTFGESFQAKVALDLPAEVLLVTPGARRLTLWLQDACANLAQNFENCMDETYKNIIAPANPLPISSSLIDLNLATLTNLVQVTAYAAAFDLTIPNLANAGSDPALFSEISDSLFHQAWFSSQNHLIRAWVYQKNF